MTKLQKISLIGSVGLSLLVVAGAIVIASSKKSNSQQAVAIIAKHSVSHAELAKADGQHGHKCYVAVDGTVYLISGFSLWQNGQHLPSHGLAYCGADLSKVIDQAPHGRKILDILPKVGPLVP